MGIPDNTAFMQVPLELMDWYSSLLWALSRADYLGKGVRVRSMLYNMIATLN